MSLNIKPAKDESDFAICMAIRMEVFMREQGVPLEEEMDGKDNEAQHYLATLNGAPVGTGRLRIEGNVAKLERIAVRKAYRGQGVGTALIDHMMEAAKKNRKLKLAKLGAQVQALPFYEKLGFEICSEEYLDANIPHKTMQRKL